MAARIGGDKFAVIVSIDADDDASRRISQRILTAMAKPFALGGSVGIDVGCSTGATLWSPSEKSQADVVERADRDLCGAKRGGKNAAAFSADMAAA